MTKGSSDSTGRRRSWRIRWLVCGLVAAMAVMAAAPAVASAAISSARLTSRLTSVAVAPTARISVTVTKNGKQPSDAQIVIESGATSTTSDCFSTGASNATTTHNVPVPSAPGVYSLTVNGFDNDTCTTSNSHGLATPLAMAVRVVEPSPNPTLPKECGQNVMLVLDESAAAAGHAAAIRAGALAFLRHLSGTGAHVAITTFASTAQVANIGAGSPYLLVNDTTISKYFAPYINDEHRSGYNPTSSLDRNWQDALDKVGQQPKQPRLVVFMTAGNPTTFSAEGNEHNEGEDLALSAAVEAANGIKAQDAHIFAVGVGNAVSDSKLKDISGDGDVAVTNTPAGLVHQVLAEILRECRSSLTVTKLVDNRDGKGFQEAEGWTISAKLTNGHHWVRPPAGSKHEASLDTNARGNAHFRWRTGRGMPVRLKVNETVKHDYEFTTATCRVNTGTVEGAKETFDKLPITIHVGRNQYATCELRNTRTAAPPGPPGPPPECGDFDSAAPECPSTGGPEGNGPGGTSPGGSGPGTPGPGDGPGGTAPGTPGPGGTGPGGQIIGATTLTVTMTLPRLAHVGQRVPVTITVKNVGAHTAHDVTVHDTPPGAGRLEDISGAHATRQPDGTVLLTLDNLKPGASKTVHARMLIARGAVGRLQNTVAGDARNAEVVLASAVVRVPVSHAPSRPSLPRPRPPRPRSAPPPRVTG